MNEHPQTSDIIMGLSWSLTYLVLSIPNSSLILDGLVDNHPNNIEIMINPKKMNIIRKVLSMLVYL